MKLTLQDKIAIGVDILRPQARFARCDTYQELVRTWTDEREVPSEQAILDAADEWAAMQASAAKSEASFFDAGIQALIDSLNDPNPDRELNPAQVRFGLALLAKQVLDPGGFALSDVQRQQLNAGLSSLLSHLSQS